MERILLAVGFRQLEEYIEKQLKKEYMFVGATVYREGVIRAIGQKNPDIVIVRETLEGNENILSIIYEIRSMYPKVRIVFLAGNREPGDALLATLVSYGVYDILHGRNIKAQEVVSLIRKPNEYKDIKHLQPVPVLGEDNKVLFKPTEIVKEVIKEVHVPVPSNGSSNDKKVITDSKDKSTEDKSTQDKSVHEKSDKDKLEEVSKEPESDIHEKDATKTEKQAPKNDAIQKKEEPTIEDKKPAKEEKAPPTKKPGFFDKLKTKDGTINPNSITKQKIITFLGGKDGVGNSTIALNVAVLLAQKGMKTIYVEVDENSPSVSYWYELGFIEDGIDSALAGLIEEEYDKIEEAIVKTKDLKQKDTLMLKNYKRFPDKLDFMFFSNKYLTREENENLREPLDMNLTKELFLYLVFQLEYDFVILDVPTNINHEATKNALLYSNKIFLTMTQDVSSIGSGLYKVNELVKKGMNLDKKLYYILNKYEKADLSLGEIEEWVQSKNVLTVPCTNKECINSNFVGLPLVLYSKNSPSKGAIQAIEKVII